MNPPAEPEEINSIGSRTSLQEACCTHMEGIAEKVSKLPPELRREVEDYIDYLLERHVSSLEHPIVSKVVPGEEPPLVPKPVILADDIPFRTDNESLPGFPDPLPRNTVARPAERVTGVSRRQGRSSPGEEKDILDWID